MKGHFNSIPDPGQLPMLYNIYWVYLLLYVSLQFCAVAVDCLNPLLSNKSLCGVKFEYVRAVGQGRRRHFDAFVTECFVFLPVRPRVSDFRGPTNADRGLGGPTRPRGAVWGPLNKFELFLSGRRCW